MKPLKLTMTAFGPYKQTEVVDFRELGDNDLYVISGNTGAGKTTIFDGICFALYGTASGEDRENQMMLRSDFADDDTHTSAELEFELKGRTYRILRQLGHIKQGNKSKTGDKYEFFEQIDGKEVPCVDRQIVSEINQKVEKLMGLTEDQFKQIVMLPQGEFRKLLTSETENKEEILRRLFKTDSYNDMNDQLRRKKAAAEDIFKQVKQMRDTYINQIEAVLPVREESELFNVLQAEHYNVNQVLTSLEEELTYYKEKIKHDEKAYEIVTSKHEKMQEMYRRAKTLNEKFADLEQKKIQLETLNEQTSQIKEKEARLEKAERASKIEPEEERYREWREDYTARKKQSAIANEALTTALNHRDEASKIYEQEEKNKAKRDEIASEVNRLKEYYPKVEQIAKTKQELSQLKQTVEKAKTEYEQLKTNLSQHEKTLEKNQEQIKRLEEQDSTRLDKHKQFDELKNKVKYMMAYNQAKEEEATLKADVDKKKKILDEEKEHYKQKEAIWLTNQAAVLASHLHEGEPCPVCGSHEHPAKATHQQGSVSREALDQLKSQVEKKETAYQQVAREHSGKLTRLKDRENDLQDLNIQVQNVESTMEQLSKQGSELKEEVKRLDDNKKTLDELKSLTNRLQTDMKELRQQLEIKEKTYNELNEKYTVMLATHNERLNTIPEEVQDISVLKQKLEEAQAEKQKLENQWEAAQKNFQTARENATKAEADAHHATKQLNESKQKRDEAEKRFHAALKEAQFSTEEDYRQAKMTSSDQQSIQDDIKLFHQQVAMLREQIKELQVTLEHKEKSDLNQLEKELAALKEANEQALKQWNQSIEYEKQAMTIKKKITESTEKVQESEQKLNVIADLYDVIRGQNSKKVSFERYLQIDYLDQIIDAANHRLRHLSNGQYSLIRSDRQESHGKQSGLALDVYDEYTGQTRDVKSLSGGEKFNASLCLALGMSDVIQGFQGNISIETMFIDEGFGSLDEEALNKSIDTLIDLQESGRMIGVISHVKELKAIFPAILEVNKTKEGHSETRFIVK